MTIRGRASTRRKSASTGRLGSGDLSIDRIIVDDLFGQYSYLIPPALADIDDLSKVLLLYGENGSGKTTILRLAFHLLSARDNRGHRSELARFPFRRFSVELSDGHALCAERDGKSIEGAYTLVLRKDQQTVAAVACIPAENGTVRFKGDLEEPYNNLLRAMESLDLAVYYLSDDRTLESDAIEPEKYSHQQLILSLAEGEVEARSLRGTNRDRELQNAVNRAIEWMRDQALLGSNRGQTSSDGVYIDLVRRIATSRDSNGTKAPHGVAELESRIQSLADRSALFARFRLAPAMPASELRALIQKSAPSAHPILSQVLVPYLDGVEARLDALQELHDSIEIFIDSLNSHYVGKQVAFDFTRGLTIETAHGRSLDPSMLSSGERQLLLLFCNTLSTRDRRTIFLIDEPELSLNPKWQRNLIESLLRCARNSALQFVMATHSVELFTGHLHNVVSLASSAT